MPVSREMHKSLFRHLLLSTTLTTGFFLFVFASDPTSHIELDLGLCVDEGVQCAGLARSSTCDSRHCVQLELLVLAIVDPTPVGIKNLGKKAGVANKDPVGCHPVLEA